MRFGCFFASGGLACLAVPTSAATAPGCSVDTWDPVWACQPGDCRLAEGNWKVLWSVRHTGFTLAKK